MNRHFVWSAALTVALVALGCGGTETITIGTKSFVEQAIVGQLARQLLHAETQVRAQVVECGDTFECQEALRGGRIDLMVEYTGTAALYLGLDPADPEVVQKITQRYGEGGFDWRSPLGFDNSYRLAVSSRAASRHGLASIVQLTKLPGGVRVACPRTYLRRPRDGLAALTERHGFRLRGDPLVLDSPSERIDAVLAGRADVAVVYGTDGALRNGGITLLLDSLDFFPRYDAAWLVRRDALGHFVGLEGILEQLEGKLDAEVMQELNYAAQIEGWKPANVARRFLVSRDMLQGGPTAKPGRLKLVLAVTAADELEQQRTRATQALRQVFPERPVEVRETAEPVKLVAKG
ncbi:MAG: hypothetical protein JRI68_06640, partial [Deltaproteobacteria bacterium]|nr:hypothetical protein [Deltaproteobacteria bacterium]